MYLWTLSNPELTNQLLAARTARAQVTSRAGYLVATAVLRGADYAGRALVGGARRLASAVKAARQRRSAIATLQALDDRLLSDIGISRGEIVGLVDGALERGSASVAELHGLRRPHPTGGARKPATRPSPGRELPKAA